MSSSTIAYFGYGSLVNLGSLRTPYISAHRATLKGWKRVWVSRPKDPNSFAAIDGLAFLSVAPAADSEIDGLVITDHGSSLTSLDERESLYSRVTIDNTDLQLHDNKPDIEDQFLYVAEQPDKPHPLAPEANIPRSYLDVVMQGYLEHFGINGLTRFFETTMNFDLNILEDRDNPIYPRATTLSAQEKDIFSAFR